MSAAVLALAVVLSPALVESAHAKKYGSGPKLQLYVEGASYDSSPGVESWVIDHDFGTANKPLRLWAIGRVEQAEMFDVRLSAAYDSSWGELIFDLTPSTTSGFGGYFDPSTPQAPVKTQFRDDGSTPTIVDKEKLGPHDTFGPGTNWTEWDLGDFTQIDSPVSDFIDSFPDLTGTTASAAGQINVYDITFATKTGAIPHGAKIDFDLYGVEKNGQKDKHVFARFSHNATTVVTPSPSAALGALVLLGVTAARRRRRGDAAESIV